MLGRVRRHEYLRMMDPGAAWEALRARLVLPEPLPEEEIAVADAAGRISARAVVARGSSPHYHGAAMDGFAVRSQATIGASESRPVRLRAGADAVLIDTGDPIPAGMDAVVMIEHANEPGPGLIEIERAVAPWQHVRLCGEDIVQGELVLPRAKRISAYDVGALLAAGHTRVFVRCRPRVALIPTGDELIEPGEDARPGSIIEFNTRMLAALIAEWGGLPVRYPPVRDDLGALLEATGRALAECDIVAINAGSSAGSGDHTPAVARRLGELVVHGVRVMPGKPTVLAVARQKPLLGLPGYPISTVVAADLFLRPLVAAHLGVAPARRETIRARLLRKLPSKSGLEEVIRVQVGRVGDRFMATPLPRGAGVITSLSRATGLLRLPALSEGFEAGAEADVELLVPRDEVEGALIHVGSHDLTLDLCHDLLRARHPGRSLSSANVGSLGGLMALARGECHLAGSHLLDPESGTYNRPYLARYLPGRRLALVHLVRREQGLYVQAGNPKGIRGLFDLSRVTLCNRQRGAGTRVLLDARLREAAIRADDIRGYAREEYTHMAVAVAVQSGVADTGLGIRAAAVALGLEFIPLWHEPYELIMPVEALDGPGMRALLDVVGSDEFRAAAESLGGYDASGSGKISTVEVPA
jgi:molybdopterin molybdotransferase/putative molybdopterin biosynthesis protein